MTHFIKTMVVVMGLCLALQGCYPKGPEFVEDTDVVVTYVRGDYDFKARNTYSLPDRIVKITGNLAEGDDPVFIPDATAALILTRIRTNMQTLGWDEVALNDDPDLLLTPASWESTTIYYYYDYWYWWWGGYYPGWGYPPVYASSYSTGTLVMGLIDPSVVGASGNPVSQWTGAINGILTGAYDASRMNAAIDKAFAQSPYLKTN
jgi:hypothetical protein